MKVVFYIEKGMDACGYAFKLLCTYLTKLVLQQYERVITFLSLSNHAQTYLHTHVTFPYVQEETCHYQYSATLLTVMGGTESQLHVSTDVKTVCESGKDIHNTEKTKTTNNSNLGVQQYPDCHCACVFVPTHSVEYPDYLSITLQTTFVCF